MLQSEVTHLRAPAQEEGGQRQHRRDVAHADVRDMNASGAEERERDARRKSDKKLLFNSFRMGNWSLPTTQGYNLEQGRGRCSRVNISYRWRRRGVTQKGLDDWLVGGLVHPCILQTCISVIIIIAMKRDARSGALNLIAETRANKTRELHLLSYDNNIVRESSILSPVSYFASHFHYGRVSCPRRKRLKSLIHRVFSIPIFRV